MEKTEKFRMRKYFEKMGINIYATPTRDINNQFQLCFQVNDLGSLFLGPLERMSPSLSFWTIRRSPVMMWPDGL